MLFNSYIFIFIFLPTVLLVFSWLAERGRHYSAVAFVLLGSLFFYGWWKPIYVLLILGSILFNFSIGQLIAWRRKRSLTYTKLLVSIGITGNLLALGYFKYANFFVDNLNQFLGFHFQIGKIVLPLAISFHTFQQIAYLVDTYRGKLKQYDLLHYALFVVFFPQMIAGPIVKHNEVLPQISQKEVFGFRVSNLAVGLSIFIIGLFKKVYLADGMAVFSTPVFEAVAGGVSLSFAEAWGGALGYSFQLYFDFSGYSDMALGLARMFGVKIPINFNSPYKATSIIEFWRRWHMTLSRFLRDYLYIPLGGNRKGKARQYFNLMVTMFLGGIWHGAGWNFFVWGLLHGFYLVINNLFRSLKKRLGFEPDAFGILGRELSWLLTFLCVVVGWVIFRTENMAQAWAILKAMAGFNGLFPSEAVYFTGLVEKFFSRVVFGKRGWIWIMSLLLVVKFFPNTQQIMRAFDPGLEVKIDQLGIFWSWLKWKPSWVWSLLLALLLAVSVLSIFRTSEFLYFQF